MNSQTAALSSQAPPISEMLLDIRVSFGIGTSRLAKFLRIETPTLYAWLRSQDHPCHDKLERLEALWEISAAWDSNSLPPQAELLDRIDIAGRPIASWLEDEFLQHNDICETIRALTRDDLPSLTAGLSGRHFAARYGRVDETGDPFDVITGKPFAEDFE